MEKIKVNMSPNPLDVQTIHASQNDGEARQWGFELHNNGELIDTSEVKEQLVFKAYKGGTEQLLPENGSTPTTSPFLGNIKYPQGLLADQSFTYRQSPTEEDGLAKITDIKGNTLNWNQLIENGDFSESSGWTGQFATVTISNNVASVRQDRAGNYVGLRKSNLQGLTGHKYLVVADVKSAKKTAIAFYLSNSYSSAYDIQANTRTVVHAIITVSNADEGGFNIYTNRNVELAEGDIVEFYHVMLFDLTQMRLDITDPSEFTSLFPLSYYSYNQGSLLSFNGNGIKTVGKNLVFKTIPNSSINGSGQIISTSNFQMSVAHVIKGKEYVIATNDNSKKVLGFYYEEPVVGSASYNGERVDDASSYTFISPITGYVAFRSLGGYSTPMLEFGSVATDYEPYTESTLSLPISTYFPNGMRSAGTVSASTVYDELTESKAITRVGSRAYQSGDESDTSVITDGTTTYYALVTPTETSFTTASLVTENAEITLSNEDGTLIGKCTEQLSESPGFIDAKIKLSDSDGTCYSNKLQLHVERSPQ